MFKNFMPKLTQGIFLTFGVFCIVVSVFAILQKEGPIFGLSAAAGLICLTLASPNYMKSFKAFGFEASFWENKKTEANELIISLEKLAAKFATEIIHLKMNANRFGSVQSNLENWIKNYDLFHQLKNDIGVKNHTNEFKIAKKEMDTLFLFDALLILKESSFKKIKSENNLVKKVFEKNTEGEELNKNHLKLKHISVNEGYDWFDLAKNRTLGQVIKNELDRNIQGLKTEFGKNVSTEDFNFERLDFIISLEKSEDIKTSPEIITELLSKE